MPSLFPIPDRFPAIAVPERLIAPGTVPQNAERRTGRPMLFGHRSFAGWTRLRLEEAGGKLTDEQTSVRSPGVLGKVQSGKTRAFLGIIGRCFDRGYPDVLEAEIAPGYGL